VYVVVEGLKDVLTQFLNLNRRLLFDASLKGHFKGLQNVAVFEQTDFGCGLGVFGDETLLDHLLSVEVRVKGLQAEVQVHSVSANFIRQASTRRNRLHRFQSTEKLDRLSHFVTSGLKSPPDVIRVVDFVRVDTGRQADDGFWHVAGVLLVKFN
jgi:hypothetical protein